MGYKLNKYIALLVMGFLPLLVFQFSVIYAPFLIAIMMTIGTLLLCLPICVLLLANPYTRMIEGKGIIFFNMDSTGIILANNIRVTGNWISARVGGEPIQDIFNRETVMQLKDPITAAVKGKEIDINGKKYFVFALTADEYNGARHSLATKPCLIWNNQTKSFITKDWLMGQEKDVFSEHVLLRIDRRLAEVGMIMKNFSRHVINQALKPQQPIWSKWWFWLIIVGVIGVMALIIGPKIIAMVRGATGGVAQSVGGLVTPK